MKNIRSLYSTATTRAAAEMSVPIHGPPCPCGKAVLSGMIDLDLGTPRYLCPVCSRTGDMVHFLCRRRNTDRRSELVRLCPEAHTGLVDEAILRDVRSDTLLSWWNSLTKNHPMDYSVDLWPNGRSSLLQSIGVPETRLALDNLQGLILPIDWRESALAKDTERARRRPIPRLCMLLESSPGRAVGLLACNAFPDGMPITTVRRLFPVRSGSSLVGLNNYAQRTYDFARTPTVVGWLPHYLQGMASGENPSYVYSPGPKGQVANRWPGAILKETNEPKPVEEIDTLVVPTQTQTHSPIFVSGNNYRQIRHGSLYDAAGRLLFPQTCRVTQVVVCAGERHLLIQFSGDSGEPYWIRERELSDILTLRLPKHLKCLARDLKTGAFMFGPVPTRVIEDEFGWDGQYQGYGVPQAVIAGGRQIDNPWRGGDFPASEIVYSSSQVRKALQQKGMAESFSVVGRAWANSGLHPIDSDSLVVRQIRKSADLRGLLGAYLTWLTSRPYNGETADQSVESWLSMWREMIPT